MERGAGDEGGIQGAGKGHACAIECGQDEQGPGGERRGRLGELFERSDHLRIFPVGCNCKRVDDEETLLSIYLTNDGNVK